MPSSRRGRPPTAAVVAGGEPGAIAFPALAGVAEARSHPVDRQQQGTPQQGVCVAAGPQACQQADLEVADRVELRPADEDGALQFPLAVEQALLAGEAQDLPDGQLVLGPYRLEQVPERRLDQGPGGVL